VGFFLASSLPALASPPWVTQKPTLSISSGSATHKVSAVIIKKRMTLTVGQSDTLTVKIAPAKAAHNVTWASSNTAVATVDSNGKVVSVSAGTAYVTVTTADGSKAATCTVIVGAANVAVTGVTLDQSTLSLTAGGATGTLTATVAPSTATNQNVTWTSSDPNVATVDANGVLTPVAAGTVTITVTTADGLKTATCTVNVVATPVISNVTISSSNADNTKAMNGDTITLTFTSSEPVTKLSNFKINSSNPDTFTNVGNVYTATHLVDSGDLITGVPATFQINVKNAAGLYSQTVETTSDGSSVSVVWSAAEQAVVKAETSKLPADVEAAKTLVDALAADVAPDTTKADLLVRLDAVIPPVISNAALRSNTNPQLFVDFQIDKDINISTASKGNVLISYQIKQQDGTYLEVYKKDKNWSGYLNTYTGEPQAGQEIKYGPGPGGENYLAVLPQGETISTSVSNKTWLTDLSKLKVVITVTDNAGHASTIELFI